MEAKTSISSQGYAIYKSKITDQQLEQIRGDLTIKPFVVPGYGNEDDIVPYKLFKENDEKIYVPYYYGIATFGKPEKSKLKEPQAANMVWNSEFPMRPYQIDIINTYMAKAKEIGGGLISVGCGRGKTVMGLKIAQELNLKTLILVHKEFLMNQWVERINQYMPTAKIGYIQGKTLDIARKDIVIGMIQTLSDARKDKEFAADMFAEFGLIIADECHHLAARQFCRSLAKYPIRHTLGLSATPDRADGLTRVFKYYLGDIVYKDAEIQKTEEELAIEHIPDSSVEIYNYRNADLKYCKEILNFKKKPATTNMETSISNYLPRTKFILSFLPRLIAEGRNILILSSRREHINLMEEMIKQMAIPNCTVGQYVGGMAQDKLDISATMRVILATYTMVSEGFDCKRLNTLIYGTPYKNIEQSVGRILREEKKSRKVIPLIIDVFDVFSSFKNWNRARETYYKKKGYPMKIYDAEVINYKDAKAENYLTPIIEHIKDIDPRNKKHKNKSSVHCNSVGGGGGDDCEEEEDEISEDDYDDLGNNRNEKKTSKKVTIELDF